MARRAGRGMVGADDATLRFASELTRVMVPRRRPSTVRRDRLILALHRHLDRRLQLVIAPPGYGKTTLLVDFAHEVREQGVPVCWLTLDHGDSDPRSFFEHVLLSLRQSFPGFGSRTAALLAGADDVGREHRAAAIALCNDAGEQIDEFFVLILDDYHSVADSDAVNASVEWLLRRLPDGCRIIVGSRTIPARLDLARLAAKLDVAGVGTGDLRFRADEAAQLIQRHTGVESSPLEAQTAVQRAEGWVTAILLSLHAAESARFSGLIRARVQSEPIYDYLATQVFCELEPSIRKFLVESAVLPTLDAAECDAVLGRSDSGDRIAALAAAGLFTEPLEGESGPSGEHSETDLVSSPVRRPVPAAAHEGRSWHRYHQLWREFLLRRLDETDPTRRRELRLAAARRALDRGDLPGAMEHALECGDPGEAVQLLLARSEAELAAGHAARLLDWIERLPAGMLQANPLLLLYRARALRFVDRVADSLVCAERAEQSALALNRDVFLLARAWRAQMLALLGQGDQATDLISSLFDLVNRHPPASAVRVHLERDACVALGIGGRFAGAIAHGEAALARLQCRLGAEERARVAASVHHTLGICHARLGRTAEAERHYKQGERLWRQLGNVTQQARVLVMLGLLRQAAGDTTAAAATYEAALRLTEAVGHLSTQVIVLINMAGCRREERRLEAAQEAIERALLLARQTDESRLVGESLLEAGLVALARGTPAEALNLLTGALDIAERYWPAGKCSSRALVALAHARLGDRPAAHDALKMALGELPAVAAGDVRLRCAVTVAAAAAALGDRQGAVRDLRATRRWARDRNAQAAFLTEVCQFGETARLMLGERRLAPDIAAALQASIDLLDGQRHLEQRDQPRLRAVPAGPRRDRFSLRLFGPPTLVRNGLPVLAWRTTLAREVLFFLAVHAGSTVRSETLIDALIPESDYDRSVTALRHSVYHVRRLFAPTDPVHSVRGGYRFEPPATIEIDLRQFDRALAQAHESSGRTGPNTAAQLSGAIELYRGPLLEGLDAEWVVVARAEVERRFMGAAQELLSIYRQHGDHRAAIDLAEHVLKHDPYQDDFHVALLRHQIALGQSTAARRHFQEYARVVRAELGNEPTLEARELVAQLSS